MHSTSESLLIRLKSEASSDDWCRFVHLYTPLIFYWARKAGLSREDSADLVQDVLTIVYQKLPAMEYDPDKSFRGWLRTVTLNRHRELLRRKKIKCVTASQTGIEKLPDPNLLESTWDIEYGRRLVASAMEIVKPDFEVKVWAALEMLIAGRKPQEISRQTGVNVWTIYSAKNRLMARLRRELDGLME